MMVDRFSDKQVGRRCLGVFVEDETGASDGQVPGKPIEIGDRRCPIILKNV